MKANGYKPASFLKIAVGADAGRPSSVKNLPLTERCYISNVTAFYERILGFSFPRPTAAATTGSLLFIGWSCGGGRWPTISRERQCGV
jgi:hypothetical protein